MTEIHKIPQTDPLFGYLLSMLPPVSLHKSGAFIAGGSARKLFHRTEWHLGDVDVFFSGDWERATWTNLLQEKIHALPKQIKPQPPAVTHEDDLTVNLLRSRLDFILKESTPYVNLPSLQLAMSTENADTFHLEFLNPFKENQAITVQLQIIKTRYAKSIQDLWKDFDFTVSCFAVDANEVWALPQAVQDCAKNKLTLHNSTNTKNLVMRVIKHHAYGFEADDQLLMKVADKIVEGDFEWSTNY